MSGINESPDCGADDPNCDQDPFWGTSTGYALRYGLVGGLIFLVLLYFSIGYLHASRRIRQGKPPLAYHRWMVRDLRYGPRQPYHQGQSYQHGQPYYAETAYGYPQREQYPLHSRPTRGPPTWVPPPPAYNAEMPPAYVPDGASKMNPDQHVHVRSGQEQGSSASHGPTAPAVAYRQDNVTQ